jgi:hypothetical protein
MRLWFGLVLVTRARTVAASRSLESGCKERCAQLYRRISGLGTTKSEVTKPYQKVEYAR